MNMMRGAVNGKNESDRREASRPGWLNAKNQVVDARMSIMPWDHHELLRLLLRVEGRRERGVERRVEEVAEQEEDDEGARSS